MCLETGAIPRSKSLEYKVTLSVYPVSLCGGDLQKGEPLEVHRKGNDLLYLKSNVDELVLSAMYSSNCEGLCFVEMLVTVNGEYHSREEWWCDVDLSANTVTHKGGSL